MIIIILRIIYKKKNIKNIIYVINIYHLSTFKIICRKKRKGKY